MTGLSEGLAESLGWDWSEEPGVPPVEDALAETVAFVERHLAEAVTAERAAIREALGGEVAVEAAARAEFDWWVGDETERWEDQRETVRRMYRDAARPGLRAALDSLGAAGDGGGEG